MSEWQDEDGEHFDEAFTAYQEAQAAMRRDNGGREPEKLGAAKVLRETDKALLVELEELGEERWIPKSVVHDDSEVFGGGENDEGEMIVQRWWALENGLC